MTKACQSFFERKRITRIVCMLLLVVLVLGLTGCSGNGGGGRGSPLEKFMNACWLCPMFEKIYDCLVSVAENLISSVALSSITLLAVGYALWLVTYIMKYVSSVKEPDVRAFWKNLITQTLWVIMGVGLLTGLSQGDSASAMTSFAEPVFGGFVEAGIRILQSLGSEVSCSGDTRSALLCLVGELHNKLGGTVVMSLMAMKYGGVFVKLIGVIVCIVAVILMVRLPLLLVDCVFRYGIALCMLPLGVAAYPFKVTRKFSGLVAKIFMEVGFAAMGLAAFAACCVKILRDCIAQNAPFLDAQNVTSYSANMAQLEKDVSGPGMMTTLFVSFFLIIFSEVIFDFMNALSGGAGGIGKSATATIGVAKKAGGAAKKAGSFAMNRAGRMKDKQAYKRANKEPSEKPVDYDYNDKAKKKYDKEQRQRRMAQERLEDRGYTKDGKPTDAMNDLTKNEGASGFGKVKNALSDLREDWNESAIDRSERRQQPPEDD